VVGASVAREATRPQGEAGQDPVDGLSLAFSAVVFASNPVLLPFDEVRCAPSSILSVAAAV